MAVRITVRGVHRLIITNIRRVIIKRMLLSLISREASLNVQSDFVNVVGDG